MTIRDEEKMKNRNAEEAARLRTQEGRLIKAK